MEIPPIVSGPKEMPIHVPGASACPVAYIGLGSNIGDRLANCRRAIEAIAAAQENRILQCSPFYETEPAGEKNQDWFVNGVVEMETSFSPHGLMDFLMAIEKRMGRVRDRRWGPRIIDLDILFYGQSVIEEGGLSIPHPRLAERLFVLAPLSDIAPQFRHPVLNQTVAELREKVRGKEMVLCLPPFKGSENPCIV